jgi:myo-inositol-1-phosphate synthase
MHVTLGGYHISDIEFSSAFDRCKLAMDRGMSGTLEGPSSYFMQSPPQQVSDAVALQLTEEFIAGATTAGDGERPTETPVAGQVSA